MLVVILFYTQDFGDGAGGKLYMHNTALKNDADEDVISLSTRDFIKHVKVSYCPGFVSRLPLSVSRLYHKKHRGGRRYITAETMHDTERLYILPTASCHEVIHSHTGKKRHCIHRYKLCPASSKWRDGGTRNVAFIKDGRGLRPWRWR